MAIDFSKFGASGTNINTLNPKIGALGPYIQLMEEIYPQTAIYTPEEQAFLFFTKMAEESSKPGATAIGAAGAAGTELMKTKLASKTLEQKRAGDIITGAVGLSTAMKLGKPSNVMAGEAMYMSEEQALEEYPQKDYPGLAKQFTATTEDQIGKPIISKAGQPMVIYNTYQNGVLTGIKLLPQGEIIAKSSRSGGKAVYVAEDKAEDYILNTLGIDENHKSYQQVLDQIVPKNAVTNEYDEDLVGKSIVSNQKFAEWEINEGNNQITSVILKSGDTEPFYVQMIGKRLDYLASHQDEVRSKVQEIAPLLDSPMEQLLSGATTTGADVAILRPFEEIKQGFWAERDERGNVIVSGDSMRLAATQNLRSLAFKLAPLMRPKGSGSTSDMEFKAYMAAILDLKNSPMTNYLNMYALQRISKISGKLMNMEMDLLSSGNYTIADANREMEKVDPGIYAKYTGPINTKQIIKANPGMTEDVARQYLNMYRSEFILNMPRGDVMVAPPKWINRTVDTGQDKAQQQQPFYIQGWGVPADTWQKNLDHSWEKHNEEYGTLDTNINQPWNPKWKKEE